MEILVSLCIKLKKLMGYDALEMCVLISYAELRLIVIYNYYKMCVCCIFRKTLKKFIAQ